MKVQGEKLNSTQGMGESGELWVHKRTSPPSINGSSLISANEKALQRTGLFLKIKTGALKLFRHPNLHINFN